jgi:hypothetical protein
MAASQKTQDLDVLSVRKIYAKGDNNTTIPANSFLGTDGIGGTRWVDISTIKNGITFNTFTTTQSTFTSGPASSKFSILDGDNAGLEPTGSGNSVKMYAKAFGEIIVLEENSIPLFDILLGKSSIKAFNPVTGNINSNVILAGSGVIDISTDPNYQLIKFYSPDSATSSMSTVLNNFTNLNKFLSTTVSSFNSPFSTFIYSAISSFSTFQGSSVSKSFTTERLNVSTISMSGTLQPFIQYGSNTLLDDSNTITLSKMYRDSSYIIQLTYVNEYSSPTIPLSFNSVTPSNFVVFGDSSATFHWTTYGNVV